MKKSTLCYLFLFFISCSPSEQRRVSPIQGTWKLLSQTKIEGGDTTVTEEGDTRMIKIINETHFAFLNHDVNQGKDSTKIFVAGGGAYSLQGDQYTEHLEYCNYREWENNTFKFTVSIQNDTLVQQGTEKVEGLGVDRIIIEKYKKVSE